MPSAPRVTPGGLVTHVLSRSVAGQRLFREASGLRSVRADADVHRQQPALGNWQEIIYRVRVRRGSPTPPKPPTEGLPRYWRPPVAGVARLGTGHIAAGGLFSASRPYGSEDWQNRQADALGWWHTLHRENGRRSRRRSKNWLCPRSVLPFSPPNSGSYEARTCLDAVNSPAYPYQRRLVGGTYLVGGWHLFGRGSDRRGEGKYYGESSTHRHRK